MIERAAAAATYGGAGTAMFFGLSANEVAALGGLVIGFLGLCVQAWYARRRLQILERAQKRD